jgi:hypothetical protein
VLADRVGSFEVPSAPPSPGGIVIPTKPSADAYEGDYQPVSDPLIVLIDRGEIALA